MVDNAFDQQLIILKHYYRKASSYLKEVDIDNFNPTIANTLPSLVAADIEYRFVDFTLI